MFAAGSCRKVDGEGGANVLLVDFRPATPTTGERISLTGMQTVESQGSNRHCATLARIFNQGTAIAKQNQHFILSDNLYHISN